MAAKLLIIAACVATAVAYSIPYPIHEEIHSYAEEAEIKEPEIPIPYHYAYSVHDPKTGDVKSQAESSDGHNVKGYYSMKEADGTTRIVKYTAGKEGFNAEVKKEGTPIETYEPAPSYHSGYESLSYETVPALSYESYSKY